MFDSSRHDSSIRYRTPCYRVGRALYNAYGHDEKFKALFATGPNAWNVAKLAEYLAEQASGTVPRMENDKYSEMPKGDDAMLQSQKSFLGLRS